MLGFIYSNQSILLVLGVILILLMFYVVAKKLSTKVVKKQETESKQDTTKETTHADEGVEEKKETDEPKPEGDVERIEETSESETKKEKDSKKPKIVQIYKRRERKDDGSANSKQDDDPIYNRNVEFVNTSKNIAKFKSFAEEIPEENLNDNDLKDEFGFVAEEQDDCEFCEVQVKHFDHSKRLSDVMKDDVDLFESHISEKYLNINSDRHLNLNRLEGGLFERADQMLKNSESKVKCECEGHEDCSCEHEDCCHDEDDEVQVNMKTALIADTYFNRKRKK